MSSITALLVGGGLEGVPSAHINVLIPVAGNEPLSWVIGSIIVLKLISSA